MLWSTGGFIGITKCSDFAQKTIDGAPSSKADICAGTVGVIRLKQQKELCIICIAMAGETMYLYNHARKVVHL